MVLLLRVETAVETTELDIEAGDPSRLKVGRARKALTDDSDDDGSRLPLKVFRVVESLLSLTLGAATAAFQL